MKKRRVALSLTSLKAISICIKSGASPFRRGDLRCGIFRGGGGGELPSNAAKSERQQSSEEDGVKKEMIAVSRRANDCSA